MARTAIKLSDLVVAKLPAPDLSGKPKIVWDAGLTGFGVLISGKTATKSWVVQRGSIPRKTIERTDLMSIKEAREVALDWLKLMGQKKDPKAVAKASAAEAKVAGFTLAQALDDYLAARKGGGLRDETRRTYRAMLAKNCADWMNAPIASLTPTLVARRHRETMTRIKAAESGTTGNSSANLTARVVLAVIDHIRRQHPNLITGDFRSVMRGAWAAEPRRERTVPFDKLPAFWAAVDGLENNLVRVATKLIMLTGCRVSEIRELRWNEVDLEAGTITLAPERNKAGRRFTVPLSDLALTVLRDLRALGIDASGYCFPGRGSRPISSLDRAFAVIAKAIGQPLSPHDLRRLFATVAMSKARLGVYEVKGLLNHSKAGDVTAGYVIQTEDDLRAATQKVTDALKVLCGMPGGGGNVVPLRGEVAA